MRKQLAALKVRMMVLLKTGSGISSIVTLCDHVGKLKRQVIHD